MNESENLESQKSIFSSIKENLEQFDNNMNYSYKLLKFKFASYLAQKRYVKKKPAQIHFNGVMGNTNFLVLMPENDVDFINSFDLPKFLSIHRKFVTVVVAEYKFSSLVGRQNYKVHTFGLTEVTRLSLPTDSLIQKIDDAKYDVVIDMNRTVNIFFSALSNAVKSKIKVGFKKEDSDKFYNFQVVNNSVSPEVSYKNMIESIKMF